MPIERSRKTRQALLARLPEEGAPGMTLYGAPGDGISGELRGTSPDQQEAIAEAATGSDTGFVLLDDRERRLLILPPFPLDGGEAFDEIHLRPLVESLDARRSYAVFLLRLGGFSIGFFRGEALIDSKTDQRFVKGKHRKGGQSSTRFARIREKQVHELFKKACEESAGKLGPYEDEIEHLFFGGDRRTLQAFEKECAYFERFGTRRMARILPAHGDPRLEMLRGMPREVWSSEVYEVTPDA